MFAGPSLAASPFDPATWLAIEANNAQILALPPDASRNFQISLAYQDIGVQFSALLRANATMNWATMAKWASNTVWAWASATSSCRTGRRAARGLARVGAAGGRDDADLLDRLLEPLLNATSVAPGGNRAVLVEIGGAFSAFGVAFANATAPDEARLAAYLARFTPDQRSSRRRWPVLSRDLRGGESNAARILRKRAFALEEQTRVQPYLETAFYANVTVDIFGRNVTLDFSPPFTRLLMSLVMPAAVDAPRRAEAAWDGRDWAVGLDELTTPGAAEFYAQFARRRAPNTSVTDWVPLHQRMKYIRALFRSRTGRAVQLVQLPATAAQERSAGRRAERGRASVCRTM